jgi:hypothetical protein
VTVIWILPADHGPGAGRHVVGWEELAEPGYLIEVHAIAVVD